HRGEDPQGGGGGRHRRPEGEDREGDRGGEGGSRQRGYRQDKGEDGGPPERHLRAIDGDVSAGGRAAKARRGETAAEPGWPHRLWRDDRRRLRGRQRQEMMSVYFG